MLVDGDVIDPLVVKGGSLTEAPLVFLNACQVGSGQETLGDYAGLAESFLFAGASAVVAPLWSIDDGVASALAERFYTRAFDGETVAEIVRAERAAFGTGQDAELVDARRVPVLRPPVDAPGEVSVPQLSRRTTPSVPCPLECPDHQRGSTSVTLGA